MTNGDFIDELRALDRMYKNQAGYGPRMSFYTRAPDGDVIRIALCQALGQLAVRGFDAGLFTDEPYRGLRDALGPAVRAAHVSGSAMEAGIAMIDWLRENGHEVNEPDQRLGPFERVARACESIDWRPFTEMRDIHADLLRAMVKLGAKDRESRQTGSLIAEEAGKNPDSAKGPLRDLVNNGLAGSVKGRSGGAWIQPAGETALDRWERRRKASR